MSGMRIVGGQFRGKRLVSPPDRSIRPTGERAREALFDIVENRGLVREARWLDLFAGTGAVGLEAFSRGAALVWLIDREVALLQKNVEGFGRPAGITVKRLDATRLGKAPDAFDVAFMDPPYGSGLAEPTLLALREGWLAQDALIVVELAARETLDPPDGFEIERDRRYGQTRFVFLRRGGERADAEPS